MRISDTLKKAAGLFVEFDQSAEPAVAPTGPSMTDDEFKKMMGSTLVPGKTIEQIVKDSPGPNLDEIKVPANPQAQPLRPDGTIDFSAIYAMANVQDSAFTAEQLLELLATLPVELPLESRRQTVKITIQAMAKTVPVTPQIIVADASRKLAALAAYEDSYAKQASDFVSKSEAEIKALEAQIESKKAAIEDANAKHETMTKACTSEADRLDDVLEFFSLDVPPSKHA
jgi:hypothetical protein